MDISVGNILMFFLVPPGTQDELDESHNNTRKLLRAKVSFSLEEFSLGLGPKFQHLLSNRVESTIDSEGFKGGTRVAPIMPRDAVSRTANVGP